MNKEFDAIIVGGGLAGFTAAAFLSRAGKSVLLCEQAEKCGGLVNTFEREGFYYDGGIRALENSGVLAEQAWLWMSCSVLCQALGEREVLPGEWTLDKAFASLGCFGGGADAVGEAGGALV